MKIAIVTDVLGSENNGTSITTMRLIESLKERGHQVNVVAPEIEKKEGNYPLTKMNFYIFNDYVKKNGVELAKVDKDVILDGIKDCDIVHIMLPFFVGCAALKIAKSLNKPVTAGFHCQAENLSSHLFLKNVKMANNAVYKIFNDTFYSKVDAIHCPTEFIKNVIEEHGFTKPKYVISNGVAARYKPMEVERPDFIKGKFAILTVGRLAKEKQHAVLIDAIAKSKHEADIQLICAGDGPIKNKIMEKAKVLTNPPIFNFYSGDELVKLFNSCDLYVHPADVELEGIACIEAISCGMVPVVNDSPRCATKYFALTPNNIFALNDSDDLAKKIDYFIENPTELAGCKKQYESLRGEFALSKSIDQMEIMFEETIKRVNGEVNS